MKANLEIYIQKDCLNCDEAEHLAEVVQARLPEVRVSLIDLARPDVVRPEGVFAVPTYVLNGQTYSLGNPDQGELIAQLQDLLSSP